MAPRPNWKGYLKLSLVSCSIALYPATSSAERISFRQINKKTGNRLKQQLVDSETGEAVQAEDKGRGYEVDKNAYIQIEDEELEALQVESNHTIAIEKLVPIDQIDERYYDSPYYIVPNDEVSQEAFAVIRDAMKGKKMGGLGRVVLSKRERPILLEPFGKGLRGMTLRYPYEVRDEKDYFDDIADVKVDREMLKLAEHILESKAADFDPSEFVDHYETALADMLKAKQAGQPTPKGKPDAPPQNVINLMDALKRSMAGDGKSAQKAKKPTAKEERLRREPQFKFPIKGGKKEEAKVVRGPASTKAKRKSA
jgi:DNA end-binding protein Ku